MLWDINKLLELKLDILCASELLILTSFPFDLLFILLFASIWVLVDTEPTICDLGSTEFFAAYTRSFRKIAGPPIPVPKIAANPASSLK